MTELDRLLEQLDYRFPTRGFCGFCGGPDARHRLWDAIEQTARIDGEKAAMREYGYGVRDVRLVVKAYAEARRRERPLPGRYPL